MELSKKKIFEEVSDALLNEDCVIHAKVYGSWLYNERSVDMDIAVIVKSCFGVVDPKYYRSLYE